MNKLSKKIKELREQAGLNSRELALKSKLSPAYISKLESGEYKTLTLKTLKQLSEGLGLTLKLLLERLGFINNGEKQGSGEKMVANALRGHGFNNEQTKQIIQYAEFIKKTIQK